MHLLASMAELERATILERVSAGRQRIAREGKYTGGIVPFGYSVIDHTLKPNEDAIIVSQVF
jgi:site-specific DNA recombinase